MDATQLIALWTVAGMALLALVTLQMMRQTPLPRTASAAPPPNLYASTAAPTSTGGGSAGGASPPPAAGPLVDAVSRRKLLRWVGWTGILLVLGQLAVGFLPFFWPRKVGAFGGRVLAGNVDDYKVGEVRKIVEGKFFVSRVPEGFLALWQKCPHLGCAVPWDANGVTLDTVPPLNTMPGRFNCPCHGSRYDRYGALIEGPAPRPMDLFRVTIESGRIFVQTGPNDSIKRDKAKHGPGGPDGPVPA